MPDHGDPINSTVSLRLRCAKKARQQKKSAFRISSHIAYIQAHGNILACSMMARRLLKYRKSRDFAQRLLQIHYAVEPAIYKEIF